MILGICKSLKSLIVACHDLGHATYEDPAVHRMRHSARPRGCPPSRVCPARWRHPRPGQQLVPRPCPNGPPSSPSCADRGQGRRIATVALPYGTTELCPIRALRSWQKAAGNTAGAVFWRIWTSPRGRDGNDTPCPGSDLWRSPRIIQTRAARAGFGVLGGQPRVRRAAPAWTATFT
jgi:hypothetical protein